MYLATTGLSMSVSCWERWGTGICLQSNLLQNHPESSRRLFPSETESLANLCQAAQHGSWVITDGSASRVPLESEMTCKKTGGGGDEKALPGAERQRCRNKLAHPRETERGQSQSS